MPCRRDSHRVVSITIPFIVLALTTALPVIAGQQPAPVPAPSTATATPPQVWARVWTEEHLARAPAPQWVQADVEREVQRVVREMASFVQVESIGASIEGRAIYHLQLGRGAFPVLLWSQMHGDESSATPALFDLIEYFYRHRGEPTVDGLLERLTLHIVPMLNPDGAQRFTRRNSQGIDINRDALRLQTPEGQALKALRDRLSPRLGFNLHNQGWRTSVGRPPKPATISLLSVAFDQARTVDEGRRLTKRVCSVIRDAIEPLAPGQVGRYDDDYEVRAFGDNVTRWGTPVVLIETGPWAGPDADRTLTQLNFVALMSALDAVATGRVHDVDPARYETLQINEDMLLYALITNATVVQGTGVPPFIGDIGLTITRSFRDGRRDQPLQVRGSIEDIGDLRVFGALETIDATGKSVAPLRTGIALGDEIELPGTLDRDRDAVLLPGRPAALMILGAGAQPGRYRVERIIDLRGGS